MAELTMTTFLTMDGVMQTPCGPNEGPGGWLALHFEEDMERTVAEIFSNADAFLFEQTTYDAFSAYWPNVTDPQNLIAVALNSLPKFVASRSRFVFPWQNSMHLRDVVNDVNELKQGYGREIQVLGSCSLAQTLIEHDLVDEYRLLIFPVIVGTGKRLFGTGSVPRTLKLVKSSATRRGVIVSVYRRTDDAQERSRLEDAVRDFLKTA